MALSCDKVDWKMERLEDFRNYLFKKGIGLKEDFQRYFKNPKLGIS